MLESTSLLNLLKTRFGFESFRPYQEEVCQAAVAGEDLLLVMPTGAGKSLCYQLPGVGRSGTTLVISPLLALIEDQVQKLKSLGFHAERIHSGRDRMASRQVCQDYLNGKLDFLFIAPERLAVPGFSEMLAKKTLALIAVDEAHCISQWGHDFRPEYRMLGGRLPQLRGSQAQTPVIALTATATPLVQKDIVTQLALSRPKHFIHGFRRTNIAVEVLERSQSDRPDFILNCLREENQRPAIVYASTRKSAESIAAFLATQYRVGIYHAGLSSEARDQTQSDFLSSKIEVMVATIAFGMGIDKANVRTVIHASLPSSLEGYYQEIGRAGRDGLPSKAILLWSYADRKMHEFLNSKNYPEPALLDRIVQAVKTQPEEKDSLRIKLGIDFDSYASALEKLWIHGGIKVDADEVISAGEKDWLSTYNKQRKHRSDQLLSMAAFAEGSRCRMLHLVRHFGDEQDSGLGCGSCDVCQPNTARMRAPDANELFVLESILSVLRERDGQSIGKIHRDHFPKIERNVYEKYLNALAKSGFVSLEEDSFTKDGREITYRSAYLSHRGEYESNLAANILLPNETGSPKSAKKTKSVLRKKAKADSPEKAQKSEPLEDKISAANFDKLKAWRLSKARQLQIPAFMILSDRVLKAIAAAQPKNEVELEEVHGMGAKLVKKHGREVLGVLEGKGSELRL